MQGHRIVRVEPDSIAHEIGIQAGDYLLALDGAPVADVLDYRFRTSNERVEATFASKGGEEFIVEIEKDADEDLGLEFESPLMSRKRSCANNCVFCFVDQQPDGVRDTLRFKDDDWRLSFLHGNFVTLTNVGDTELSRIIAQRVSPLYISVHATNPELRAAMLNNPRAAKINRQLARLSEGGIAFYAQIVLCPGYNDGEMLSQTLTDLLAHRPQLLGIAIVPVGLTRHRAALPTLRPVSYDDAVDAVARVCALDKRGRALVHLADEFYLLANHPIPPGEAYGDYAQIEDGVGLLRMFVDGFDAAIEGVRPIAPRALSVATGEAAYPTIRALCARAQKALGVRIDTYPVKNRFFGGGVNVAGLLTGECLLHGLRGKALGERLLLPRCVAKDDGITLLDDMTVDALAEALSVDIRLVDIDGAAFVDALCMERE